MQGAIRNIGARIPNGLLQSLVVFGYALSYGLSQRVSFSFWALYAGFRLAALIFLPRRYWLALAVGEVLPLGYLAITCAGRFGVPWAVLTIFPSPVLLAMPIVYVCQLHWRMMTRAGELRMGVLLLCMCLVSALWTVMNTGRMAVTQLPPSYHVDYLTNLAGWFVGNLLGTLTVVPIIAFVRIAWQGTPSHARLNKFAESRLIMETVFLLIPALSLLLWVSTHADSVNGREAARMAMFFPVVILALRHGWQGAALGGTLASTSVALTMTDADALSAIQAETFTAFAITTMLLLGSRISVLNQRDSKERVEVHDALLLARRNIAIGEERLRVAAECLEHIREIIRFGYEGMLSHLQHIPTVNHRLYVRHAATTQEQLYRLSDGLYPSGWRDRHLPAMLQQGAIARALDQAGINYWCETQGDFSTVSHDVHINIFRLIGECVALACDGMVPTHVRVRVRSYRSFGRVWVGVQLRCWTELDWVAAIRLDDVRLRLGRAGLTWHAAEGRARTFQGRLRHVEASNGHNIISAVLVDPQSLAPAKHSRLEWTAESRISAAS